MSTRRIIIVLAAAIAVPASLTIWVSILMFNNKADLFGLNDAPTTHGNGNGFGHGVKTGITVEELSTIYESGKESDSFSASSINVTRVLITRTISPSEIQFVIDDIMHVKSFYTGHHHHREKLIRNSRKYCSDLKQAGYAARLDPYANGSQSFPNHLLCSSNNAADTTDNNYYSVRVDFMLFTRSESDAQNISKTIDQLESSSSTKSIHQVNVDILDVSHNPKKIWNWIGHCTPDRLANYDYAWFIDGDITLTSLNWQAFWQQVKLMRPKIAQASIIGKTSSGKSTVHPILRFNSDARVMAAEVPIVELGSPLLEVETWVGYRDFLVRNFEVMRSIEMGGEQLFDLGWCHYAKNNLTGYQGNGGIGYMGYMPQYPSLSLNDSHNAEAGIKGRACVVFYQTPMVHMDGGTFVTNYAWSKATHNLVEYFRQTLGVVTKPGLKSVYHIFNAPIN